MARRQYQGSAVATTITGGLASSGALSIVIADATGWPDATNPFTIVVSPGTAREEKMLVTARAGTTLTVTSPNRGYDDTTAVAHNTSDVIRHCGTSNDFDEANEHVNKTSAAHAASAITFSPTGNIAATTVQAAIAEVDSETDTRLDAIEANNWVTNARMADNAVDTAEIVNGAVNRAKVATGFTLHARSSSAPSSPSRGDTWLDTDTMELFVYYGSTTGWQLPWNRPWGVVAYAEKTSSTTSIGTGGTSLLTTGSFTAVANRRYRLKGHARISAPSTEITAFTNIELSDGSAGYETSSEVLYGGGTCMADPERIMSLSAGSTNLRLFMATSTGTVTNSASTVQRTFLMVEDIGPLSTAPSD